VINPAEREAGYVIDGLLQNDVIKSDIHSTDTHGYSEIIFALTHLIGVSFAPRIKNIKKQQLYSFEKPSELIKQGYNIVSKKMIHPEEIEKEWDNILRLIATIKLKEATASQLLKRVSSYSIDHPLYRALKHFGRIIKTIFLLKYIDEVELRQMIEKQLNKIESANKMSKAVFFGNGNEFQVGTPNEQLIAVGCKRLIENCIICWNYLYLSKYLKDIDSVEKKKQILELIVNSSVVTWQHINLQGEYDFSDEYLKDTIQFSLPELLSVLVG
jgi:TnpA family transposase